MACRAVSACDSELLPLFGCEGGFFALVKLDLPEQLPVLNARPAPPHHLIAFIESFECKLDPAIVSHLPIQTKINGPKPHLTLSFLLEGNETRFNQVNELLIPLFHLNQTPFADYILLCGHGFVSLLTSTITPGIESPTLLSVYQSSIVMRKSM